MTQEEQESLVSQLYQNLWPLFHGESPGYEPASLRIVNDEFNRDPDGYDSKLDVIELHLFEGDLTLEEVFALNLGGEPPDHSTNHSIPWPTWKRILIHEMAHELEKKKGSPESEEGRAFLNGLQSNFEQPEKHGVPFYSAVVTIARILDLTPESLVSRL